MYEMVRSNRFCGEIAPTRKRIPTHNSCGLVRLTRTAFAGDGTKIHSAEMPPEIKEAIAVLSGPVGKALASVVD